jgi:hypothetical protein
MTTLLVLALFSLLPTISAQAPSQAKIAACQASLTIPSYQDYYYYDVNDTTPFSVTYQYDGTREFQVRYGIGLYGADRLPRTVDGIECTGVPVAGVSFTDYTTGATSSCTS